MTYNELLNQLIDNSGKMLKEIAEECTQYGVKLTNNYLSVLKTSPEKIASDDISRAIAKACNAKYEDILIVQAYLDRAPKMILDFIEGTKKQSTEFINQFIKLSPENEITKTITVHNNNTKSTAEFICENAILNSDSFTKNFTQFTTQSINKQKEKQYMVIKLDENIQVISEDQKQSLDKQINQMSPRKA